MMSSALLIILLFETFTNAQWTPDPFCPYPSDQATRYPYYGNCSLYWECYKGEKYVMECPEGLEFNTALQKCEAPQIANCVPYPLTTREPTEITTSDNLDPQCPYPSEDLIYFPFPEDCTKYFQCFEGIKYLYFCPTGLWWNQKIEACDKPGDFCDNSTSPTTTPNPSVCPYPDTNETIYIPYPGDCTKYWECSGGDAYLYTCPDGLWWNPEKTQCDYPGTFCDNSTVTTRPPETTTVSPTTPVVPKPDCPSIPSKDPVFFPFWEDCSKYWECSNGDLYLYTCPDGLWWHQNIAQCDYPGEFCTLPECPSWETDNPIFYPYDGDCTKYWECSDGTKYLYTCPDGLWWHQDISQCDYPGGFCKNSTNLFGKV